jgi:HEAT repeat protein
MGGEPAIKFLIKALRSGGIEVRQAAADALKIQLSEPVTLALAVALEDSDPGVRGRAALALEKRPWRPGTVREQIWFSIARGNLAEAAAFGPEAIEPLEAVLQSGPYNIQINTLRALGEIQDERILNSLIPALKSADHAVSVAAIEALTNFGGPRAAEAIASTLKSADHRVRAAGAEAMAKLETRNAAVALSELLADPMWDVRRAAANALGKLQDPQAVQGLLTALNDPDPDVRETAITSLGHFRDPRSIAPLVLTLVDPESAVRRAATFTLPLVLPRWPQSEEARRVIPELRAAVNSNDSGVRYAATNVLKQLGESALQTAGAIESANVLTAAGHKQRRVFAIFVELLADADRDVRLAAAESLGRLGDKRAASALMTALSDGDDNVKRAASRSLEELGAR